MACRHERPHKVHGQSNPIQKGARQARCINGSAGGWFENRRSPAWERGEVWHSPSRLRSCHQVRAQPLTRGSKQRRVGHWPSAALRCRVLTRPLVVATFWLAIFRRCFCLPCRAGDGDGLHLRWQYPDPGCRVCPGACTPGYTPRRVHRCTRPQGGHPQGLDRPVPWGAAMQNEYRSVRKGRESFEADLSFPKTSSGRSSGSSLSSCRRRKLTCPEKARGNSGSDRPGAND